MTHKWDGGLKCRTCGLRRLEVATTSSGHHVITAWALAAPKRRMRLYAVRGGTVWSTFQPRCVAV